MKCKFLLLALTAVVVFFIAFSYLNSQPKTAIENSKNQILLRKIGHELLLSSNDSTSKVLPIKSTSANEFQIEFEKEIAITPDTLFAVVKRNLDKTTFTKEYAVQVLECSNNKVVYGFVISLSDKENIVPCLERKLSLGCYRISIQMMTQSAVSSTAKYSISGLILLGLSALIITMKYRKKTKANPKSESNKSIQIGNYFFYYEQHYVDYQEHKIVLTGKESKLLYLFFTSPNVLIDRNTLQKEVWENEGIIVTRSLDMFISKLRKKLDKDPKVAIINVHGIGYKLEVL